jgi:hypothetical protein
MQCSCGCNQSLSRRQIQRHLRKQVVPRLVAAAVAQFRTLGRIVSAPRLNSSKKQRSSRRYLPSSPEVFEDDEILVDQLGADGGHDSDVEVDSDEKSEVEELAVLRAIGRAQRGVWSGRRAAVESEDEESEGDDDDDENREDSKEEDHEYWEQYDDLEGPGTGMSALDRIGEDFERSVAANGDSSTINHDAT